jgi:hypothetical protein
MQTEETYKVIIGDTDIDRAPRIPNQRVSRKVKNTKSWQKESMDFFIRSLYNIESKRKNPEEVIENWDFYNAILNADEIKKELDPLNVDEGLLKPEEYSYSFYDILRQPFDTLFGEELKRISEVRAYAINPLVLNEKDKIFKDKAKETLEKYVQSTSTNEEELKKALQGLDVYYRRDLQSAHEQMANQILQAFINSSNINAKHKFNTAFKNLEIVGDEIVRVYHTGAEPNFKIVPSDRFFVLGLGDSNWIQDGYAWIEVDYQSPTKIIEELSEELTDKEIDKIFRYTGSEVPYIVPNQISLVDIGSEGQEFHGAMPLVVDGQFISMDGTVLDFPMVQDGNIRIYRIQWTSLRKLGKLKYFDEFGDAQYKWVDEYYPVDTNRGEEIKWIWVNEIWEGMQILDDIYKKIRPCPIQMRSLINPAIVKPSYIGYVNADNNKCVSRLDRLKPYQRMYNLFANKLVTLWTQNLGKVAVIDTSRIPSDMNTDEWYLWLKRFKLMFENSFEEGKKGAAKGLIAGNMQRSSGYIDLSLAEEINNTINMLTWIEQRVNKIAAVPEPRQGQLQGDEGLGVSQQAVSQSTHQTEFDFFVHEIIKSQTWELMIEYTKMLWKDEKGKRQFLLDDLSNHLIDIDGGLMAMAEFGVKITNSSKLSEMFTTLKQLTHAAMQTGTATLSDVARMYISNSPSEMLEQLQAAEDKRIEQQQQTQQSQQQFEQQRLQVELQTLERKHQMEMEKLDKEWQYKLQAEQMKANAMYLKHSTDTNQNQVEDEVELEKEKIKIEGAVRLEEIKHKNNKEIETIKAKVKK